ncbi:PREDICTED: uncharacterized protein LOC109475667 isoform X2 [Branchiostoma belcheri]|uniref:Uncharacterized protein LOC109475667 isoform X2 n=1 Tax=Branchiostoma belcheri TaxID=7741 RepID=A0A6P4ZQS0_BRABE|nr:PREDICTED: uncharacterized protein LOC109475667 isoform X2 [Branchiostoma belcheri]
MQRIWTPAQSPPDPAEIQVRCPEASIILSVLRRAQRRRPDGRDYYRCLYTKKFGAPPDASVSGSSQSTTDFSQATGTQMSTLMERCTSHGPLISTEPSWKGIGYSDTKHNITAMSSALSSHISSQPEIPGHFPQSITHIGAPMRLNVADVIPSSTLPSELSNASGHEAPETDLYPFNKLADHKLNGTTDHGPLCAKGASNASLSQEDEASEPSLLSSQIDLFLSPSSTPAMEGKMPHLTNLQQAAEEENFSETASVELVDADRETGECSPLFESSPSHYDNDDKKENKTTSNTDPPLLGDGDSQSSTATAKESIGSQKTLKDGVEPVEMRYTEICEGHEGDIMSKEIHDTSIDKQPMQLQLTKDTTMSSKPMLEESMDMSEQSSFSLVKQSEGNKNITAQSPSSLEGIEEDLSFDIGCLVDRDIMENFPPGISQESQSTTDLLLCQMMPQSQDKGDISECLPKEQTQQTGTSVIEEPETKTNADAIQREREPNITKNLSSSPCKVKNKAREPSERFRKTGADKNENKSQVKESSTPNCSHDRILAQAPGSAIHKKLLSSTPSSLSVIMIGDNRSDTPGLDASFTTDFGKRQDKEKVTPKSVSLTETPKQHNQRCKNKLSTDIHTEPSMEGKRATPGSAIQTKLQLWTKADRSDATPHIKRTSKPSTSSEEPPAKRQLYSAPAPHINKRTFIAPFKGEGKQPKKEKTQQAKETKCTMIDVSRISQCERQQAVTDMLGVREVSMALVYGDGTSQLREPTTKGIPKDSDNKAVGIAVAFPRPSSGAVQACSGQAKRIRQLQFMMFPVNMEEQDYTTYCREMLTQLMTSKVSKVCLDAQELILTMISHFSLDITSVYNWSMVDPKVAGWLLNPDHPPNTFTEVVKMLWKDNHQECDQDADATTLLCQDLSQLLDVMELLRRRLMDCDLLDLYLNVEMKLTPILAGMEYHGICVDPQRLINMGDILKVLFDELHLDEKCENRQKLARTSVNNLKSTSESVLVKLQHLHPLPKLVLEYRKLEKMKSTYVDGILACIKEGKLTATWDHTSAATGRLTSANPNIQSVPKQPLEITEASNKQPAEGDKHETTSLCAREPYIAREGCSFLAADFQSIEFRLLAHFSKDPSLLKVFQGDDKKDVFVELTSQWMNVPPGSVQTTDRERTKRVVYSIMYGVGPEKLATYLNVSAAEAKGFISSFLRRFPGVSRFTHKCIEECKAKGHVRTILKRWRLIPNIKSPNFFLKSQAERQAVNFVVQGSAADICKLAMILVGKQLVERGLRARLLIQLHDELVFEVADEEVDSVRGVVKDIMQSDDLLCDGKIKLQVPLRVSISVGKSWGRMTDSE